LPGLESKGLGGVTNVKIGGTTWEITSPGTPVTEDVAVTGLGFKPKILIIVALATSEAVTPTYQVFNVGFDDGVDHRCQYIRGDTVIPEFGEQSACLFIDDNNYARCHVISLDGDGFTLRWEGLGTLAVTLTYLAMK